MRPYLVMWLWVRGVMWGSRSALGGGFGAGGGLRQWLGCC